MFFKNLIDYIVNFTVVNMEADFLTIKVSHVPLVSTTHIIIILHYRNS